MNKKAVPSLAAGVDPKRLGIDAAQGFVLSRVDGRTSIGEICLLVPFPEAQTLELLVRLHAAGAIDVPGMERPKPAPPPPPPASSPQAASPDEFDLSPDTRKQIDALWAMIGNADPFALLGVGPEVDKKELKRAYFKLSKQFHPDRYFGRKLGPYQRRLQELFTALSNAFELLSDDEKRAEEAARLRGR